MLEKETPYGTVSIAVDVDEGVRVINCSAETSWSLQGALGFSVSEFCSAAMLMFKLCSLILVQDNA